MIICTPEASAAARQFGRVRASARPSRAASSASPAPLTAAIVASISVSGMIEIAHQAEPDWPPVTWRAGQPMLMSMMSAPAASAIRAPSAIQRVSAAGQLNDMRPDAGGLAAQPGHRPARARSSLAVISDTTSPAPRRAASRRNGASVTPDIGREKDAVGDSNIAYFQGLTV